MSAACFGVSRCGGTHRDVHCYVAVIEAITNYREPQPTMEAMYLIMPTSPNVDRIIRDFSNGHQQYAAAHLFFIDGVSPLSSMSTHASALRSTKVSPRVSLRSSRRLRPSRTSRRYKSCTSTSGVRRLSPSLTTRAAAVTHAFCICALPFTPFAAHSSTPSPHSGT